MKNEIMGTALEGNVLETANYLAVSVARTIAQNGVNIAIQTSALISVGLIAGLLLRRFGSAVQSVIYRATLIAVLICPLASIGAGLCGFSGWSIQLPQVNSALDNVASNSAPIVNGSLPGAASAGSNPGIESGQSTSRQSRDGRTRDGRPWDGQTRNGRTKNSQRTRTIDDAQAISARVDSNELKKAPTTKSTDPFWKIGYLCLAIVWAFGSGAMILRLMVGYWHVASIRKRSIPATTEEVSLCRPLAKAIDVAVPLILRNPELSSPCLAGVFRPAILIPDDVADNFLLQQAFAHELAHLRRRDNIWNVVQRAALALLFFQPLMWRLVYRLEATAEEVCDDQVVRCCENRTKYARQLVDLARTCLTTPNFAGLGMFKTQSLLAGRVVRILDSTRQLTTRASLPAVLGIASLALACATASGLIGASSGSKIQFENPSQPSEPATLDPLAQSVPQQTTSNKTQDQKTITGKVINEAGEPVDGVTVSHGSEFTKTNNEGQFSLIVGSNAFLRKGPNRLTLRKEGYGNTSVAYDSEQANPVLTIVNDDRPIIGRIVDTEGNPIRGAKIEISQVHQFKPGELLKAIEKANSTNKDLAVPAPIWRANFGLIKSTTSDSDGNFSILGIGRGRLVHLFVTGDNIAMSQFAVATLATKPTPYPSGGFNAYDLATIHGHKPTLVCEPCQVVEGVVLDEKTGQPVVGAVVRATQLRGPRVMGAKRIQTTTNNQGLFRLTGLPVATRENIANSNANEITVFPSLSGDLPSIAQAFEVPTGSGLAPIKMDLKLKRGLWVEGRVIDEETKLPLSKAVVEYSPGFGNEAAKALDPRRRASHQRIETDKDGKFRLVGMPGKSNVGVMIHMNRDYPKHQGLDLYPKEKRSQIRFTQLVVLTAVKEFDFAEDQPNIANFELSKGKHIRVKIVDPKGTPVSGVEVTHIHTLSLDRFKTVASETLLKGFLPGMTKTYSFHQHDKQLGTIVSLTDDGSGKPIPVKLQPTGKIIAKFVDASGKPVADYGLKFCAVKNKTRMHSSWLAREASDASGKFTQHLIPGEYVFELALFNGYSGERRIEVGLGETVDLGTIDISKRIAEPMTFTFPPMNGIPLPKLDPQSKEKKTPKDEKTGQDVGDAKKDFKIINGSITDTQGNPVSEARVRFTTHEDYRNVDLKTIAETRSTSKGTFTLKVPNSLIVGLKNKGRQGAVVVSSDGFASSDLDWIELPHTETDLEANPVSLSFKLHKSNPIRGRVVDLEGSPVSGAAVEILWARAIGEEAATKWMQQLRITKARHACDDLSYGQPNDSISWLNGSFKQQVTTNGIGVFEIEDMPIHGKVSIEISHPKIMSTGLTILNRSMKDEHADPDHPVFGDRAQIVVQPGRPIIGTIVDSKTGKPIPNVTVASHELGAREMGFTFGVRPTAKSDKNGKFELFGMPNSEDSVLLVYPPKNPIHGFAYLPQTIREIAKTTSFDPVKMKIKLDRGIWIHGTVTDAATGKGVEANIVYTPVDSNPNIKGLRSFSPRNKSDQFQYMDENYRSNLDGEFRIAGLPGKGILGAYSYNDQFRQSVGYEKIKRELGVGPTPARIAAFNQVGMDASQKISVPTRIGFSFEAGISGSYIAINPPIGKDFHVDGLKFDPGSEVQIQVVSPEGEPLKNFTVYRYKSDFESKEFQNGIATLERMGLDETRRIYIESKTDSLAIQTYVSGSPAKDDKTISLPHYCQCHGRLVDLEGKPIVDYWVSHGSQNKTDRRGHFALKKIAVGTFKPGTIKLTIYNSDKTKLYQVSLDKSLKSGQSIDLGDVQIDRRKLVEFFTGGVR